MQDNQPKKGRAAYEDAIDGISNIHEARKENKSSGTGNTKFDRKVADLNSQYGSEFISSTVREFVFFVLRYVGFLFLGLYLPLKYFSFSYFSLSNFLSMIFIGILLSYTLYCLYVYFIRTPLYINRRIGVSNKFQEYSFYFIEIILPSIAYSALFLYLINSINNSSSPSLFSIAISIALFIFFFVKLKKEINMSSEEYVPVLARWVHKLSKKNNPNFNPNKEKENK